MNTLKYKYYAYIIFFYNSRIFYRLCSHRKKRMYSFFSEYEKALCKKCCLSNRHRYVDHCLENYVQHIVYMKKKVILPDVCIDMPISIWLALSLENILLQLLTSPKKDILCFTLFYILYINFAWQKKIIRRFFISANRMHLTCIYPKSFDPMPSIRD